MQIEFVQAKLPDAAPVWLACDPARTDHYSLAVNSGNYNFGQSSLFVRRYFLGETRPNRVFVDVGANIGTFTLAVATLGVPTLAIEALPDNYVLLSAAVERNRLSNVQCYHAAISDRSEVLKISGHSAWGHISANESGIPVPSLTLDQLLQNCGWCSAAFIKIDVEGHEFPVLLGAQRLIDGVRDLDMLIEVFAGHNKSLEYLEACGFHLYMLKLQSLIPCTSKDFQEPHVTDYFCTRRTIQSSSFANTPILARSADLSARLLAFEVNNPAARIRIEIAKRLKEAPPSMLQHGPVKQLMRKLTQDPDENVRAAILSWYAG
ncbi:MAG TPA: FkbM family methyltransferase [Stellaceae bacterium]|jgi:FkbM family methyltransferase|nr:FkbM family methyltransferase [Stellaceae bacterium]